MRKIHPVGSSILVLAFLLAACVPKENVAAAPPPASGPTSSSAPLRELSDWDKVLESAKKEGTVTVYSTSAAQLMEASKAAMSKYGIRVETIGGTAGELELKIITEQRAKAHVGDLFTTGWTNISNLVKGGQAQPVGVALPSLMEKDVWKMDPSRLEPTKSGYIYATGLTPSLIINTDLVKKGDIQSWQDLLDPKWRERMTMTDPRTGSGPGPIGVWAWQTLGEDFWRKLATQRVTMQVKAELPVEQVALGEKSMAIFPNFLRIMPAIKAGAPVQIMHLKEGTSYYVAGVVLLKNAPHPNAALVFLNWIFSKEGQAAIGKAAALYSIREDVRDEWATIREYRPETFTLLEPPNNIDPEAGKRGSEFAKRIFGAQ